MAAVKKVAAKVAPKAATPVLAADPPAQSTNVPWHASVMRLAQRMAEAYGGWRYCVDKSRSQELQDNAQRAYESARSELVAYLRANG